MAYKSFYVHQNFITLSHHPTVLYMILLLDAKEREFEKDVVGRTNTAATVAPNIVRGHHSMR